MWIVLATHFVVSKRPASMIQLQESRMPSILIKASLLYVASSEATAAAQTNKKLQKNLNQNKQDTF